MKNDFFAFDTKVNDAAEAALEKTGGMFARIDAVAEYNQRKVLRAFIDNRVAETDLWGSTGYGYGDVGREKADAVCAQVFGMEDSLIRYTFTSGTHTLTVALFGLLRPGDTMLCVSGRPYDTICPVMGVDERNGGEVRGSLRDFGVAYKQIDLTEDGRIDIPAVVETLEKEKIRLVYIQRSRGYSLRPSLGVREINALVGAVKEVSDSVVFVDNCYGEFVEPDEPAADILVGSLIKNPGGGVARMGGYIAGKRELVELCAYRMTAPSLGREVGATLGNDRDILLGLFHSPHVVGEALKTAVFSAALFEELGFSAAPSSLEERHDIVQALRLENSENLIAFCRGLQACSPVDSFLTPEPWDMPGYPCKVIMAAGTFTGGSSIELSGDAPLREPFAVWMQGGLNFASGKLGVMSAADAVLRTGNR
ncbi:MAG: methionine gamma-lyase family protein [Clostridia bacterium]|nr:methionine gamma-lyase family protein [Clostridia bacterium]